MANAQLSMVNVMDFGAVGDGVQDDTAAIQQAIEFASAEMKSTVFLPAGRFKTTSSLRLPAIQRPNTQGTAGTGFILKGAGMYDSGIIYSGSDYAIVSNEELAETILFQNFYINHATGGGIRLPQGAHQWFDRFFPVLVLLASTGSS
ncbi:glycosyl hydrolase family 28-related protein [Paenibacillus senegalensis]|uniref:glycosyl hydrolase family 28-related protein n=1 Tax=Paenibacillus senegalensis TaxID=1465766 RepID=UPI0002895944|nr:glycosyl hydrolase family 28-related protein [Paenibacillus senegalensis]